MKWPRLIILIGLIMLLAACSQSTVKNTPSIIGIFSDKDIDNATPSLASQNEDAVGTMGAEISGLTEGQLPNRNADVGSDFEAQAVLPNTSGYVYYFRHESGQPNPWIIERANQTSESNTYIYTGQREIQAVGGGLDGTSVVISMRETTSPNSDFEIYRLNIGSNTVQRLTNNSVDDIDVSLSADGKTVTWQTLVSGVPSILFRVYSTPTTFIQRKLAYPNPAREPSISGNGRFITFVHDRPNGLDQLWKYDIINRVYTAIYSTPDISVTLKAPSITDDGNRVMFLVLYPGNQDIQYIDLTTNKRLSAVYSTRTLEHPFITADGKYLTYGYSGQVPSVNPKDFTVYAKEIATGQLAAVRYAATGITQRGMSWQIGPTIIAPDIPIVFEAQTLGDSSLGDVGQSIDISGNTAIVGSSGSYDANRNGVVECFSGNSSECNVASAYILEANSQGTWSIVTEIENAVSTPSNFDDTGQFARSVAILGDIAVISAPNEAYDVNANGIVECDGLTQSSECEVGRVYVFSRNQGGANNWGLVKALTPQNTTSRSPLYRFGVSVDIVGTSIFVGTTNHPNGLNLYACPSVPSECRVGSLYIFSQNQGGANNWGQIKQITPPTTANLNDSFSQQLAVSGNTLLVGSPYKYTVTPSGYVYYQPSFYIYSKDQGGAGNWGLVKELAIGPIDFSVGPSSCSSLAISNDTAVIACVNSSEKSIFIFSRNHGGTNNWGLVKQMRPSDFGFSSALGSLVQSQTSVKTLGDTILIDAPYESYDANQNGVIECFDQLGPECALGVVYVLSRNQGGTNNWGVSKLFVSSNKARYTAFGTPVALDTNNVLVRGGQSNIYVFNPQE
jgi:hypothetical protein